MKFKIRKQWLIIPEFQLHFLNRFTALFGLIFLIFMAHTFFYFNELRNLGVEAGLSQSHMYFNFIENVAKKYLVSAAITFSLSGVIFYLFGIYYSNKIAGPIYRFMQTLDKLEKDPNAQVSFSIRKDDYFKELSKKLESTIQNKQS